MRVRFRGEWVLKRCGKRDCQVGALRVRRDPLHVDSWWVGEMLSPAAWRIAATDPVCPRCGGDLIAGLSLVGRVS